MAKSLGLSSVHGAIVAEVAADSPASRAGIQTGDVILQVNGQPISDSNDLRNRVSSMAPGSKVDLDIQRNGHAQKVTATLTETETKAAATPEHPASDTTLGMTTSAITPEIARELQAAGRDVRRGSDGRG